MEKFYPCDCGHEVIVINDDPESKYIYLGKYYWSCQDNRPSLRTRIKDALKIIFKPHRILLDEVVLTYSNAKRLGKDLLELTTKNQGV